MDTGEIIELIFLMFIMMATIGTNVIQLLVIGCTDYLRNINRYFFYSISISDLCSGLLICPFAVYGVIFRYQQDDAPKLCHVQAYLLMILFLSGLYAISWMNVDHYVAVRKPERYKVMMSPGRSLCWILFAWIAAVSFSSPPMLSFQDTIYYNEVFLCTVYIGSEIPYFITAGVLALMPPVLTLLITDIYLFTHGFKKKQKMYEAVLLDVSSRPRNYQINFLVSVVYLGTWLPWLFVRVISFYVDSVPKELHFFTFWLAMGNGFYKFFIYSARSLEYRRGLRELVRCFCLKCRRSCCNSVPPRQTVNLTATRVIAKPSTSGPAPAHV